MTFQSIAPPLDSPVVSAQNWADLCYLHWPVDPDAVRHFYPPGTHPDVFQGQTYVGLIPFRMHHASIGPRLPIPYFGSFLETNVRLYSVDDEGRHGVLFRSLDCQRLAVSLAARFGLGVGYRWASMGLSRTGDRIDYSSRRRVSGAHSRISIRVGAATEATDLETWLTARWGLHTRVLGRTLFIPNEHPTWALHEAELLSLESNLVETAGIEVGAAAMLRPLWTPGVRTTFGLPIRVR